MGVGDENAPHVFRGESEPVQRLDDDGFARLVGPTGVHHRHAVVSQDGVGIHRSQIRHWKRQRDAYDLRGDVVHLVAISGQATIQHSTSVPSSRKLHVI
jgi:hypothetical protein